MDRIESLRRAALSRRHSNDEFYYRFYKSYTEKEDLPESERYSSAFLDAFATLSTAITDGELIVGETSDGLTPSERLEWESKYRDIAKARASLAGGGQDSHMSIDYELLLSQGINGITEKIDSLIPNANGEQLAFYKSVKICLAAVVKHSENYAKAARSLAEATEDEKRREELRRIARVVSRVPREPASSFYEAIQSVHFISYCLSLNPYRNCFQQFQLGHPDRYLYPYYKNDIEKGVLTREEAQLLLDSLALQINMRVPHGLSSGYMVGGRDANGRVVSNELTEMLLDTIENVSLVYPAVGLCYTDDMPKNILDKAVTILSHGRSHPAIFNDDLISSALRSYGVSDEESRSYIHSTCVEITPVAASNVWVASPYTNMAAILLSCMEKEYSSTDELIEEILSRLDAIIKRNFELQSLEREKRKQNSQNPLLSAFVNDCLSLGTDIERGGARYNWIMPSFVGMANLVDSLVAIDRLVFTEKRYTVRTFKEILDKNFDGNESLLSYIRDSIPKYGNDFDEIDHLFSRFTEHIVSECKRYSGSLTNSRLIPSVFCWVKHERFGKETGATPDGRLAGFPLGDGSGPCQGRERNGPTASILSSTKWDHSGFIGGVAVNMKFSRLSIGSDPERALGSLRSLIEVYMPRGGFELQINVTDKTLLERARLDPDSYRDLIVRIGGYSDYFTRLTPEMQSEVILRTEHSI